ncbi:MAG: hypothetical protein ACLUG5_03555 [Clostridia bacterium]|jgi:hypothetical protein|uniref:hypothetical protein n=1 Tax=Candidatus Merdicola sp. TaxID=3085652 RepID=UPI002FA54BBB
MENEGIINKRVKDFSKGIDIMQTILIFLIALLVPTFLGGILSKIFGSTSVISTNSQLIVGTIVNAALVVSAINLKGWAKILGVVTMPSISTILSGYVFGTASVYMVYMIPAIWIGNFALIYSYKFLMLGKNKHYFLAGIVGIIVKVAIIFALFNLINLFGVFPEKLVENLRNAMGMTQLITATLGVIAAFVIYKLEKK